MAKTISLQDEVYDRLREAAEAAGYQVHRGPGSRLGEFVESLLQKRAETNERKIALMKKTEDALVSAQFGDEKINNLVVAIQYLLEVISIEN